MINVGHYEVQKGDSATPVDKLLFTFISKGKQDVNKVVAYQKTNHSIIISIARDIFNLGFGDYEDNVEDVNDLVNSNNGDVYKVFNTVLHTIPTYFERYPDNCLFVKGSDRRRTDVYCNFISKHYDTFSTDYTFYGLEDTFNGRAYVPFKPFKLYEGVLFLQKS